MVSVKLHMYKCTYVRMYVRTYNCKHVEINMHANETEVILLHSGGPITEVVLLLMVVLLLR